MPLRVDCDAIASGYDRRYLRNEYSGVEHSLTDFVGRHADTRVLEVGCGTGHWLRTLHARTTWAAGLDSSIGMLAYAREQARRPIVQGVAEHLPWATSSFRRVLRPGGQVMTIGLDPHTGTNQWYGYDFFEPALENDRRRYAASRQIRDWMFSSGEGSNRQGVAFAQRHLR